MIEASGFQRGDQSDLDPLFYRGKSPVLGRKIEVRTAGELPAEFPATGPAPQAPTKPTDPGPPSPPLGFPELSLPEFPELPGEPLAPKGPSGGSAPGQQIPWWQEVLSLLGTGTKTAEDVRKLLNTGGQLPGLPAWLTPSEAPFFSLTGAADQSWYSANPGMFSAAPDIGAPGQDLGQVLNPADFNLSGAPGDIAPTTSFTGAIGPGLQGLGGLAGMIQNQPGSPGFTLGAANTVGGAAGTAAALAPEMFGALAPVSPVLGIASLPMVLGTLLNQYFGPKEPHWPAGWQQLGSNPNQAVDPMTGRILEFKDGSYTWSAQTQAGQPATPEQFVQWGIYPGQALAGEPGYGDVGAQILSQLAQQALQASASGQSASPGAPVPDYVSAAQAGSDPYKILATLAASGAMNWKNADAPDQSSFALQTLGPQAAGVAGALMPVQIDPTHEGAAQ